MMETPSKGILSSQSPFCATTISDSVLHKKMSFLRKYFAAVVGEFMFMSMVCSLIMLSPIARFYVTENDWLLYLLCFLYCASYLSLPHFIKLPMIDLAIISNIMLQAFAVSVLVTYNDMMYLYQAILTSTCVLLGVFLYTLQSKWDFNMWVIIFISCLCICLSSAFLRALLGGTEEESYLSIAISILILAYHSFAVYMIMVTLTPSDFVIAIFNAHTMPVNLVAFLTPIYRPPK